MNEILDYKKINTYPEMTKKVKAILKKSNENFILYALKYIEELEEDLNIK